MNEPRLQLAAAKPAGKRHLTPATTLLSLTAQTSSRISGRVKNAQGQDVPDAQLRLFRQGSNTPLSMVSGAGGDHHFDEVEPSARIYAKIDNLFHETYCVAGFLAPWATFVTGIGYSF
jgi:hypothetical protein